MNQTLVLLSAPLFALAALAQEPAPAVPPQYVGAPLAPQHAVTNRAHQGIPSLAVAPKGRLWATWYAGVTPAEDHNNYVVLSTSGDNGKTWKEVLVVDPDAGGPRRTFDPELWLSPDGEVRWFWADRVGGDPKTDCLWMMELAEPDAEQGAWKPPVCVARGVMMCKPITLSTGEWAMPLCTWFTDQSSKMMVSTDTGKTWTLRGGCNQEKPNRTFDEHMFVERKDRSIWLLVRTKYGIGESVSNDRGQTWPDLKPSALAHPSARFFISRLKSGNLLLVKHGPIAEKTGRSHLTAYISADDGKTWGGGLMLDERNGVSYPDGQQTPDGLIRIVYDFDRLNERLILVASFREEDAAAGKAVTPDVSLRQLVCKASGGKEKPPATVEANADGDPLLQAPAGSLAKEGAKTLAFEKGAMLFTDRKYAVSEVPAALSRAQFVQIPMNGNKEIRCSRVGAVYFLTPVPARNGDSMMPALQNQGFRKVKLPEVRLFDPGNPGNFCTLYQKTCAAGEVISVGKWAVPLFFP